MAKKHNPAIATAKNIKSPRVIKDLSVLIDQRRDLSQDPEYETHVREFRRIRIEHPRLLAIRREINELRVEARTSRGDEQYVLPIIGPSHSGKSIALKHYLETVVARENVPKGHIPLLKVVISNGSSLRQLQADILSPLVTDENGIVVEKELQYGTQTQFRMKVKRYAEKRGTEAIALEEAQHLIVRDAGKTATAVAESIKLMAIEGAASFIVIGVEDTWRIFQANSKQLPLRCKPPIFLNPLDFEKEHEAEMFAGYVADLDLKLVEHGLTTGLSGFTDGDMIPCFWEVSRGINGYVSRVVREAWQYARALNVTTVPREFLEEATARWAISLGLSTSNPFRCGARPIRVVKNGWKGAPLPEIPND
jgi:hypothetical protein